jgi:hypothetical protein
MPKLEFSALTLQAGQLHAAGGGGDDATQLDRVFWIVKQGGRIGSSVAELAPDLTFNDPEDQPQQWAQGAPATAFGVRVRIELGPDDEVCVETRTWSNELPIG